jgi:pimeloyl-ACP methyl ester carboxylesterase
VPQIPAALEAVRTLFHPGPDSADYGRRERSEWLDIDWSQHRRRASVLGSEVEYVDLGEGDPIVWIHGLGACWQTWLENLPFFSESHRCIALDLPGFGASEMPERDISIDFYSEVTYALLDQLGVERSIVVGNSMGGFIGADMATDHPQRVERLVLVSAAVFWQEYRRAKPLLTVAQATEASLGRALASAPERLSMRPRLRAAALGFGGFRYPHLIPRELQVELIRTARRTEGFVPALASLADYPLRDDLQHIECPTLVVWGTHDTLVGVKHAHELEALIPSAEKVIFERTGHVPMLERPDRFNRVMAEFISAGDGGGREAEAEEARRRESRSEDPRERDSAGV